MIKCCNLAFYIICVFCEDAGSSATMQNSEINDVHNDHEAGANCKKTANSFNHADIDQTTMKVNFNNKVYLHLYACVYAQREKKVAEFQCKFNGSNFGLSFTFIRKDRFNLKRKNSNLK